MCHCEERSDAAISCNSLRFRRKLSAIRADTARLPRRPLASSQCQTWGPHAIASMLQTLPPCMAVTDRRYRRNWSARFYRQPVRIGSIAPGGACPSPTTHSWRPSKTIHFPLSTCRARCPGFCNIIPAVLPLPSASGCAGRSRRCGSQSACRLRRHRAEPAGRRRGRPASE